MWNINVRQRHRDCKFSIMSPVYYSIITKCVTMILKAMTSAEIDVEVVYPLKIPSFPPGTHEYDPKIHSLIEGMSKCMITSEEAQAKCSGYRNAQWPHDEVYTDGSKINEKVGAAAVIKRHFQNGETICRMLTKRLPNNSTIFAAEATAITLALNYYWYMGPIQHDVIVYSDSMSCLQAIEGKDTETHLICQIMNLLWALSDTKGVRVCFWWVPSHCGIEGNEIMDQLAKETLDHDIDSLTTVHYQSGRSPKVVALFLLQTLVAIWYDFFNCMMQSN